MCHQCGIVSPDAFEISKHLWKKLISLTKIVDFTRLGYFPIWFYFSFLSIIYVRLFCLFSYVVWPTISTFAKERESFHRMIQNITKVEQHTIGFLKHPMFPHFLYSYPQLRNPSLHQVSPFFFTSLHTLLIWDLDFVLGLCPSRRPVMQLVLDMMFFFILYFIIVPFIITHLV